MFILPVLYGTVQGSKGEVAPTYGGQPMHDFL